MSLITTVRTELGESSAVFWSNQQIVDALNEAQVCMLADYPQVYVATATVTLATATDLVAFPSTIMLPQHVLNASSDECFFTSEINLEGYTSEWRSSAAGTPDRFIITDGSRLRFYPKTSTARVYTIKGIGWPTELTTGSDTLTIDATAQQALVHYAVSILFTPTRPDLAEVYYKMYMDEMDKFRAEQRRKTNHIPARLKPGDARTKNQTGALTRWR